MGAKLRRNLLRGGRVGYVAVGWGAANKQEEKHTLRGMMVFTLDTRHSRKREAGSRKRREAKKEGGQDYYT